MEVSGTISNIMVDLNQLKNNDYEYGFVEKAFDTFKDLFCWSNRVAAKTLFIEMMTNESLTKEQFVQKFNELSELASATGKKEFTIDTNGNGDLSYKVSQLILKTFPFERVHDPLPLNIEGSELDETDSHISSDTKSSTMSSSVKGSLPQSESDIIEPAPPLMSQGKQLRAQNTPIVLLPQMTLSDLLSRMGENVSSCQKVTELLMMKSELNNDEAGVARRLYSELQSEQLTFLLNPQEPIQSVVQFTDDEIIKRFYDRDFQYLDQLLRLTGEDIDNAPRAMEILSSPKLSQLKKAQILLSDLNISIQQKEMRNVELLRDNQFREGLFSTDGKKRPPVTIGSSYTVMETIRDERGQWIGDKALHSVKGEYFAIKTLDNGDCSIASIGLDPKEMRTKKYVDNMIQTIVSSGTIEQKEALLFALRSVAAEVNNMPELQLEALYLATPNNLALLDMTSLKTRLATPGLYLTQQELGLIAASKNIKVILVQFNKNDIRNMDNFTDIQTVDTTTKSVELGDKSSQTVKHVLMSPNSLSSNVKAPTHFSTLKVIEENTTQLH
ncbi:hypothetical protein [uncultured Shewanella sp.]|uniref:hypothetical protein n=1 Tax=uncultured Shewanella sp. TaxID=173975 RepID=UPI00260FC92D|nr:hypothetical protein [uncultured Shewanella sp.]